MKKITKVVALLLVLVMGLTACGGSGSSNSTGNEKKNPADYKIGMVTDVGGVNDGSFNQSSWEGLQRAGKELGVTVKYLESKGDADYTPNIETFVDEDYDLIISVGYMLADATKAAAESYPDKKFAIIDDNSIDLPNVTCLMFEQAEASYLAGVVAAMATETDTVGLVLGMSSDSMNQFGYGYVAGALDTNPDIKVLQYNANSFADPASGKSGAVAMITNGADVIFQAAGGSGLGAIEACVENKIWAIGVDTDQSSIAPETIITSAMKRVDNACYDAAKAVLDGTLEAGVKTYALDSAGVDLAPTTTNLTSEILDKVEAVKADIISGKIDVPTTKAEFDAMYGDDAYELDN